MHTRVTTCPSSDGHLRCPTREVCCKNPAIELGTHWDLNRRHHSSVPLSLSLLHRSYAIHIYSYGLAPHLYLTSHTPLHTPGSYHRSRSKAKGYSTPENSLIEVSWLIHIHLSISIKSRSTMSSSPDLTFLLPSYLSPTFSTPVHIPSPRPFLNRNLP